MPSCSDLEKGTGCVSRFPAGWYRRQPRGSTLSRQMPRTLRLSGKAQLARVLGPLVTRVGRPCRDDRSARCVCPVKLSSRVRPRPSAHVRLARRTAHRNPGKSNLEKPPVPFSMRTPIHLGMFRAADRAVPRVRQARFAPPTLRFSSRSTFEPLVTLSASGSFLSIMNLMRRPQRR